MKLSVGAQATIAACLSKWITKSGTQLSDFQVTLPLLGFIAIFFMLAMIGNTHSGGNENLGQFH